MLNQPAFLSLRIEESTLTHADLSLDAGKLLVHFISHRKTLEQATLIARKPDQAVLAINLRSYVDRWWSTCDPTKLETMKEASTATAVMRAWLRNPQSGKTWIANPEFEKEREKLRAWIKVCKQQQQAEARTQSLGAAPERPPAENAKPKAPSWRRDNTPDTPDQDLGSSDGRCVRCGGELRLVCFGSGMFKGKIGIRCSRDIAHPLKIL